MWEIGTITYTAILVNRVTHRQQRSTSAPRKRQLQKIENPPVTKSRRRRGGGGGGRGAAAVVVKHPPLSFLCLVRAGGLFFLACKLVFVLGCCFLLHCCSASSPRRLLLGGGRRLVRWCATLQQEGRAKKNKLGGAPVWCPSSPPPYALSKQSEGKRANSNIYVAVSKLNVRGIVSLLSRA